MSEAAHAGYGASFTLARFSKQWPDPSRKLEARATKL